MLRLLREVRDLLGEDPRPGREDEVVVRDRRAALHDDGSGARVDPDCPVDEQPDLGVEQRPLGPRETLLALSAHGDVHEARLVDVRAEGVDEGHVDLALRDGLVQCGARARLAVSVPPTPPPRIRIRCIVVYLAFSTTISS